MRLKTKRNIFTGLKTITAALLIILQVYPIFYVIISSMKTTDDFRSLPSYALPSALNFENYIKVFTTSPMLNYFKNSIIITVGVLIPLLLISFMAGFALSKIQFRGNKKILSYFLLATVYKGNIIKNLIMDCQSYTKYRPNETTGGIFVSWRRKEELPTGA